MSKEKFDESELPELNLVEESEERVGFNTIRKRKTFNGTTNSDGRSKLPPEQTREPSYPYGFAITVFQNYGGLNVPSGVGDAVFVIENWSGINVVCSPSLSSCQWVLDCTFKALRKKKEDGSIRENLLDNVPYGEALPIATIIEYYIST